MALPYFLHAYSYSSEQVDRDLKLLAMWFLQLINLPVFGLGAILFSLLGMILVRRKLKIIGLVFLAVFALITLFGLWTITSLENSNPILNKIFWIELAVIIICTVLLTIKRTQQNISRSSKNLHSSLHEPKQTEEEKEDDFPYFK